jgi:hypothetical protein
MVYPQGLLVYEEKRWVLEVGTEELKAVER